MFNLNDGIIEMLGFRQEWQIYTVYIAFVVVTIAASYLLGSINSAIIISKLVYRDDIRKHGSGNAGMTNMQRTYGGKAALLTLAGDLGKTVLSICVAGILFGFHYVGGICFQEFCYVAGLFAVLGHIFPIYYGFKGGKGVLATATMALVLSPIPFVILMLLFVLIVWRSRYVSLGSVSAAVLYPVVLSGYFKVVFSIFPGIIALCSILLAIIIVWCHRGNLERISNRTERKLSFGKKKTDADAVEPEKKSEDDE